MERIKRACDPNVFAWSGGSGAAAAAAISDCQDVAGCSSYSGPQSLELSFHV